MPQMFMDHGANDPAKDIIERVGDLSEIEVPLNKVLVGIYVRSAKTAGGIHLPDSIRDEDMYQGKAAVVLKRGPMAFVDDERVGFHGFDPQIGDWILFRPSNGLKLSVRKVLCVLLSDSQIELKIPVPDLVF